MHSALTKADTTPGTHLLAIALMALLVESEDTHDIPCRATQQCWLAASNPGCREVAVQPETDARTRAACLLSTLNARLVQRTEWLWHSDCLRFHRGNDDTCGTQYSVLGVRHDQTDVQSPTQTQQRPQRHAHTTTNNQSESSTHDPATHPAPHRALHVIDHINTHGNSQQGPGQDSTSPRLNSVLLPGDTQGP